MIYNIDFSNSDFTKVVRSIIGDNLPKKGYKSAELLKFFSEGLYRHINVWYYLFSPNMTDNEKESLNAISKKIARNFDFINEMHCKIANKFIRNFTDRQLLCILRSIASYQTSLEKEHYDVRGYTHVFLRNNIKDFPPSYDLYWFKSNISHMELTDFEIFENLILQLLEENDSDQIFNLVKSLARK